MDGKYIHTQVCIFTKLWSCNTAKSHSVINRPLAGNTWAFSHKNGRTLQVVGERRDLSTVRAQEENTVTIAAVMRLPACVPVPLENTDTVFRVTNHGEGVDGFQT